MPQMAKGMSQCKACLLGAAGSPDVREIVGSVCWILTIAEKLTHHSMQHHEMCVMGCRRGRCRCGSRRSSWGRW